MDYKTMSPEPSLEKQLKGHKGAITSLFYNPNGQQIASSSLDHSVLLWDLRGTMRSYRFQGHDEAVMDVTFSPTGKYMASASRDKTVRLWVPTVTGSTGMFKAHSQTVRSVQFSQDSSKILTASDDKIVKLWSSEKHKFIASFVGHTNWVRCARMSQDGSVVASCSDDKTTRLWNPDTGECIHIYKDQKGYGMALSWHPSGCYIAIGTSHGNVKVYDIRTHTLVQYYSIHSDAVTQLTFHPSGSYILTSSKDGKMKILDLLEGHPIFTLSGHSGPINCVAFSKSGDTFASAGEDKLVFIWRTNFTELANEHKENEDLNQKSKDAPPSSSTVGGKVKGSRLWYQCYHSSMYPIVTFVHLDDATNTEEQKVNSTFIEEPNQNSDQVPSPSYVMFEQNLLRNLPSRNVTVTSEPEIGASESLSVGHMSHIPRPPPNPATYSVPLITKPSIGLEKDSEELFGMIKLKESDICYTSGTIEWVGRKRTFPINTGFKIITDLNAKHEPLMKKMKIDTNNSKHKNCDCADVLPTVNAIIDHLNALHEAVDLVDLRLGTLEDMAVSQK